MDLCFILEHAATYTHLQDTNTITICNKHLHSILIFKLFNDIIHYYNNNWWHISSQIIKNTNLPYRFVIRFQDKLDWWAISQKQTLSEDFIRDFQHKVDWKRICNTQTLSEDCIREFQDKVHWWNICNSQKRNENFSRECMIDDSLH